MSDKVKFQAIKGVRDILPPESALWNRVEQAAREVFGTFGFAEIRLPIFEQTELFARSVGQETDIVSKEMYTFEDKPASLPDSRELHEIGLYVEFIEAAVRNGEIPNTAPNLQAIRAFRKSFEAFAVESQKHPVGFSQGLPDLSTYIKLFHEAVYFAQSVQLGEKISLRPGSDGVRRARLHRARDADAARQREAVLHGADVPARAAAEGALSPVLSDRRGSARGLRTRRGSTPK